ncbi:MAG: hypothetical protein M1480_00535 [Bacteroidetes bacterium]|nr:hypothetical protein [Bacteroidota bacterium]
MKTQNKNNTSVFILIFIGGLLIGFIISFSINNPLNYFYLKFSEIIQVATTLVVGIYVSYYLGNKITNLGKQKEIILNSINKLENQTEKLQTYFLNIVYNKNKKASSSIISLLDNMIALSETLLNIKNLNNHIFLESIEVVNDKVSSLWDYITGDELNNLNYKEDNIEKIKETIHSLKSDLHNCKINLFIK